MSELFGGLDTPKWMSPWDESLVSAQVTAQVGRNFAEAFNHRMDLEQQNAQWKTMLPLREAQTKASINAMDLDAQGKAIQLERDQNALEYQNSSKVGEAKLAGTLAEIGKAGSWNDPASRARLWDVATENPALLDTPIWKQTQDNFMKADKAAAEAEHWRSMAEIAGEKTQLASERFAAQSDFSNQKLELEKSKNAAQSEVADQRLKLMQEKIESGPKEVQLVDQIQKAQQDAEVALKSGDTAGYQRLTDRANMLKESLAHGSEIISTGFDDQGRPTFSFSRGSKVPGGATVGTASVSQQKLVKYENATQLINGLQRTLRPMDVGAAGVAGEYLGDRLAAQVPGFEGLFSKQRVDNRTVLGAVRESLMREIGDDRRFTSKDREDIAQILPSSGVLESYADATARLQKVKDIIIDRSRVYAQRVGEPIPMFARTKDEIIANYQQKKSAIEKARTLGTIEAPEADSQLKQAYDESHDALMRFH